MESRQFDVCVRVAGRQGAHMALQQPGMADHSARHDGDAGGRQVSGQVVGAVD